MDREDWLFPQNSSDIEQFFITLRTFANLNGISRKDNIQQILMEEHSKQGKYNPYIEKNHHDLSSANHKIDEPRFYGAIYETPNKKIHVSSYGELLLKYENDIVKKNKVFIAMLCIVQFYNPYKKLKNFNIYPLRLIFKLLIDERIGYLTNLEVASILYKVKSVESYEVYEKIVKEIIDLRNKNEIDRAKYIYNNPTQLIKNYVSCNFMFNMITNLNIVNKQKMLNNIKIQSVLRKKPTTITECKFTIDDIYKLFISKLLKEYKITEPVKNITGLRSDWIREIYNSVPSVLLESISESDKVYSQYLQIPKLLVESSTDSTKWDLFEEYITKGFNLFEDVKAETIGGPGQPDTLARFVKNNCIFCADGKSTNKKLTSINNGRLRQHRDLYNAKYTIVVTPGYVPSAVQDIKNTETCIITSHCFADLITKYIFKLYKNKEECSYEIINELILNNLGTDISDKIYNIIDERLGISVDML